MLEKLGRKQDYTNFNRIPLECATQLQRNEAEEAE